MVSGATHHARFPAKGSALSIPKYWERGAHQRSVCNAPSAVHCNYDKQDLTVVVDVAVDEAVDVAVNKALYVAVDVEESSYNITSHHTTPHHTASHHTALLRTLDVAVDVAVVYENKLYLEIWMRETVYIYRLM